MTSQILLASFAATLIGLSKSGIPNLGIFAVMLMLQSFSLKFSAAVLLPILIAADVTALKFYKRHLKIEAIDFIIRYILIGGVLGGLAFFFLDLEKWFRPFLGVTLGMAVCVRFAQIQSWISLKNMNQFIQAFLAMFGGFMTLSSHAGGPFISLCLLYQNESKESFLARFAFLFFLINMMKIPIYYFSSALTQEAFSLSIIALPFVFLGAYLGRQIQKRISLYLFERITLTILAFVSIRAVIQSFFSS